MKTITANEILSALNAWTLQKLTNKEKLSLFNDMIAEKGTYTCSDTCSVIDLILEKISQ